LKIVHNVILRYKTSLYFMFLRSRKYYFITFASTQSINATI